MTFEQLYLYIHWFCHSNLFLILAALFCGFIAIAVYKRLVFFFQLEELESIANILSAIFPPFFLFNCLFFSYKLAQRYIPIFLFGYAFGNKELSCSYQFGTVFILLWISHRIFSGVIDFFVENAFTQEKRRVRFHRFVFFCFYLMLLAFLLLSTEYITGIQFTPALEKIITAIIVWSLTSLLLYMAHALLRQYSRLLRQNAKFLAYALLKAVHMPLLFLIGGSSVVFTLNLLGAYQHLNLDFPISYWFIIMPPFFWLLMRIIQFMEEQFLIGNFAQEKPDKNFIQTSSRFIRILVIIITATILFLKTYKGITPVLGVFGGSAVLFGIIGRNVFENYLSGITIYLEGNFKVGDLVSFIDMNQKGEIEYVGLLTTKIRTLNKEILTIPNSYFSSNSMLNISQMTKRRIRAQLLIETPLLATVEHIVQEVRVMLQNHPGIDQTELCMVHFLGVSTKSFMIDIYVFTKTKDLKTYRNVHQDILFKTLQIIQANRAKLGCPTYQVTSPINGATQYVVPSSVTNSLTEKD